MRSRVNAMLQRFERFYKPEGCTKPWKTDDSLEVFLPPRKDQWHGLPHVCNDAQNLASKIDIWLHEHGCKGSSAAQTTFLKLLKTRSSKESRACPARRTWPIKRRCEKLLVGRKWFLDTMTIWTFLHAETNFLILRQQQQCRPQHGQHKHHNSKQAQHFNTNLYENQAFFDFSIKSAIHEETLWLLTSPELFSASYFPFF